MLITYILHKFRDTAWMKEKCLISASHHDCGNVSWQRGMEYRLIGMVWGIVKC